MNLHNASSRQKIKIGISSCLIGEKVRYDGNHQYHAKLNQILADDFELLAFCPEISIGLGVPREKIQLVSLNGEIVCLDQATYQIDYTQALTDCYTQQSHWLKQISGYIFKTKSPSCGLTQVKTDFQGIIKPIGQGIFAKELHRQLPELPLIEEHQFDNDNLVNKFLTAVHLYHQRFLNTPTR